MSNTKKIIIAIIITAILTCSITVFATVQIQANQIPYNGKTVEDALNELYSSNNNKLDLSNAQTLVHTSSGTTYKFTKNYKYVLVNWGCISWAATTYSVQNMTQVYTQDGAGSGFGMRTLIYKDITTNSVINLSSTNYCGIIVTAFE
jgi:hypothetical protein